MGKCKARIDTGVVALGVPAARVGRPIVVTDTGSVITGRTEYGRPEHGGPYKVTGMTVPGVADAMGRVVRAHEVLHANYSALGGPERNRVYVKFPSIVQQAVEDMRVQTVYWRRANFGHLDADAIKVARADIKEVLEAKREGHIVSAASHNRAVVILGRAVAIAGVCSKTGRSGTKIIKPIAELFGQAFLATIIHAVGRVTAGGTCEDDAKASERLGLACALVESLMIWPNHRDSPEPVVWGSAPSDEDGNLIEGVCSMLVDRLPMVEPTAPKVPRWKRGRRGSRIVAGRMARAVANASPAGLFKRFAKRQAGSVVIDASGSMRLSEAALAELCRLAPGATVAYYFGYGFASVGAHGCYGRLRIFAQGGRRAAKCPKDGSNNSVDLYAIRWLLKQQGPRVLVTDGQFCGGPDGQATRAQILMGRARGAGQLQVVDTVEDALRVFGGGL